MVFLLFIGIILLRSILHQMVEELGVLMHGPFALLEVYEFFMLPSHDARGDVMGAKSLMDLLDPLTGIDRQHESREAWSLYPSALQLTRALRLRFIRHAT
jgi:hypothetical protein